MTDDLNPLIPCGTHCQICEWEITTPIDARVEAVLNGDAPPWRVPHTRRGNSKRIPHRNL